MFVWYSVRPDLTIERMYEFYHLQGCVHTIVDATWNFDLLDRVHLLYEEKVIEGQDNRTEREAIGTAFGANGQLVVTIGGKVHVFDRSSTIPV